MDKNNIHVQSRAVIIEENHILLCKTVGLAGNFYFLPGGHIEHSESAKDALIRELSEEVGFIFTVNRFLGCLEYSFDPQVITHAKCHTHEYSFIFEAQAENPMNPQQPLKQLEENIETHWIALDQLGSIDLRPEPLKQLIPEWMNLNLNDAMASLMIEPIFTIN